MPDVGGVVGGDAADIDRCCLAGCRRAHATGSGVKKPKWLALAR